MVKKELRVKILRSKGSQKNKLDQVDGAPSHIPVPAPWHISTHIVIPNTFLQSSAIGLSPVTVSRFYLKKPRRSCVTVKKKKKGTQNPTSRGKIFAPLYSLHYLWFVNGTWLCLYKMDFGPFRATPPGPAPQGSHQNSKCIPLALIHRAIACEGFEILG